MSGIKETYVQLTTTQRDTMLRECREAQDEAAKLRERSNLLDQANRDTQARITELTGNFNRQITGLSAEMREIERKQNETFMNALHKQGVDIRQEIQRQRREIDTQINNIISTMNAKEWKEKKLADYWSNQAEMFLRKFDNLNRIFFSQSQQQMLQSLRQQLEQVRETSVNAAIIGLTIGIFNGAVSLYSDIMASALEWNDHFGTLSHNIANLNAEVNAAKIMDFEIGEEHIEARVDYWTNGRLAQLETQINEIKQLLHNPYSVNTDTLSTLICETQDLNRQLPQIKNSAKEAIMQSAYRADIVNEIASAMLDHGWRISDYTYRGAEEKDEIHLKITDNTGNEMVVIISPEENDQGKLENKLQINFFNDREFDTGRTEEDSAYINQCLIDNGIPLNLRCVNEYKNRSSDRDEVRDINRTRLNREVNG